MDDADDRGRFAHGPSEFPGTGWKDILKRTWQQVGDDNVNIVAAGVALFGLLAIFPALIAAVSIYGLVANPTEVAQHIEILRGVMPGQAAEIVAERLQSIASEQQSAHGWGLVIGLLLALWSARKGVVGLMSGLNIAYDEDEARSFFSKAVVSIALTIGGILALMIIVGVAVLVPVMLKFLGSGMIMNTIVMVARWAVLWVLVVLAIGVLYRLGPNRANALWRWITPGAAVAATLWLIASLLFSVYVRNFGNFGETYGTIGGVIVMVLWFHLSAFVILMGAELNGEMEHQTRVDTTTGRAKPLGTRGAYVADTVGERMD